MVNATFEAIFLSLLVYDLTDPYLNLNLKFKTDNLLDTPELKNNQVIQLSHKTYSIHIALKLFC